MTKFSEEIIGKIKCNKIAPVSRWHFLLKSYVFWTLFVVSVLLGSLSFGVIMHVINSGDFDIVNHLKGNIFTSTVMLLPYFWLLFLLMFVGVAYANWKSTRLGYRFKRRWIVLGSVALSVFLGNIFYVLGMAKEVDNLMTKALPLYNQSKHAALSELWFQPENGLLTGKIVEVDEATEKLVVLDETGKKWSVDDKDIQWENMELEKKGKIVKMIGEKDGENNFKAKEIRRCGNCQDDEDADMDIVIAADKNTNAASIKNGDGDNVKSEEGDGHANESGQQR